MSFTNQEHKEINIDWGIVSNKIEGKLMVAKFPPVFYF